MTLLTYTIQKESDEVVLSFSGDIMGDVEVTGEIISKLTEHLQSGILKCRIDLTNVTFMNSTGLGLLVNILTRFRNKGGDVVLTGLSESVKKLLIITKLNSIFGT